MVLGLRYRLRTAMNRQAADDETRAELAYHVERQTRKHIDEGMDPHTGRSVTASQPTMARPNTTCPRVVRMSCAANGTYSVCLTVTDGEGHTATVSHNVTVVDAPPVARLTYSCDNKASCTFDGRSSSDDLGIVSYWRQFGIDTASGAVASVSFRHNSTQTITLTVMDGAGQVTNVSQTIKVK